MLGNSCPSDLLSECCQEKGRGGSGWGVVRGGCGLLEISFHLIPQGALKHELGAWRRADDLLYPRVSQPLAACCLGIVWLSLPKVAGGSFP